MKWQVEDSIVRWLKVRSREGKIYFILWDPDPAFPTINLLPVIPANPAEGSVLTHQLKACDLPWLDADETATSVIYCPELVKLWRRERRKLERTGEIAPYPRIRGGQ